MSEYRMRLAGKCALITGASSGIGKGIALRFAREGADVVVNCSRSDSEAREVVHQIEELGAKAAAVRADISQTDSVDVLVQKMIQAFGRLDILVNNAGVFIERTLEETSDEIWNKTIDTNLKGQFLCARRCVPEMLKQGKGRIINVASIDSFVAEPNAVAYCASKAGVVGLTTALALELGPKRITVNAIAPGQIDTPLIK